MRLHWEPDRLGDGFACAELDLGTDDEGPCVATLVTFTPPSPPSGRLSGAAATLRRLLTPRTRSPVRAVLYLHGWSDYFFQRELAEFFTAAGTEFYALDLRKYGRSLRDWQTPGYVTSLTEYDADIHAALEALTSHLADKHGPDTPVTVSMMAHSTGGLVASLWVQRFPGRVSCLILNSPWLDVQGSALLRTTTQGLLEPVTRFRPKARLKLPEFGFYWRSISNAADGEWDLHPQWRPQFGFPVRAGWLTAVLAGHSQVRAGLGLTVPVLVLASARSTISPVWNESMLASDCVLDVSVMTQRALQLGQCVTVCRIEGALHDVLLSRRPVRELVYAEVARWIGCYGNSSARSTAPP